MKFHSQCEPHCFIIQCGVNKSLHNDSMVILDAQGIGVPSPQMSAYLCWLVGRIRGNERLRDMFAEPRTSVWVLLKRAAGDSGKTSPFSLGLTWIGIVYSGMIGGGTRRNRDAGSSTDSRPRVRTPLITPPWILWFMVAGVMQGTRR